MTPEIIDDYVMNEVISYAQKSVPFDYQYLLQSAFAKFQFPIEENKSIEAHIAMLRGNPDFFNRQLTKLLQKGYIKQIIDGSGKYILTERGEKAKDVGNIKTFESREKWAIFISKAKDTIVVLVIPIVTVCLLSYETCNIKGVKIVEPIRVIEDKPLDTMKQLNSYKNHKTDSPKDKKNLNDSANLQKP